MKCKSLALVLSADKFVCVNIIVTFVQKNFMSYPKSKSKVPGKPKVIALSELSDNWKDAIFNHEDCRKVFDERIKDVRLEVSVASEVLIGFFETLLPELSDNNLNLSDVDGEYEQMVNLIDGSNCEDGDYTVHPGIFLLMVNKLRANPGKNYCKTILERLECFNACNAVQKAIKALEIPIRDACIAEFYENITEDQRDDVRATVKRLEDPRNAPMPGNQGIPQFRG